jgi:urease accessory protein UreF
METLAIIGIVGNIVQFVDFTGKLISKSTELYRSSEGALAENIDTKTATNHLVLLNSKLQNAATTAGDSALESLCKSCGTAADELLAALDKVKVKGKQDKWKSIRKALRSVWSKEEIEELERRLARLKEELNLHVVVGLRCVRMLIGIHRANYTCTAESKSPSSS